eukprot:TRINITY_DN52515_c0_g1_i1.p1 TRINITY_DN52515_c0_g1~~TRINITY_DN52515_c0_g1_i1.p1  ORF type:complete len:464 (-),score=11.78 TRINITY_DN52515_c0_g1_i1:129-1520(-)
MATEYESDGEEFDWVYDSSSPQDEGGGEEPTYNGTSTAPTEGTKYILPTNPASLTEDPRTELALVEIPKHYPFAQQMRVSEDPVIHLVVDVEKLNRRHHSDTRVLVITNYCFFLMYPQGGLCRCTEVAQLSSIHTWNNTIGMLIIGEPDIVIRSSHITSILHIFKTIYQFKKQMELSIVNVPSQEQLLRTVNVKKPRGWKVEPKYVHTKRELYKRLQMLNTQDEALEYLAMTEDPTTRLPFVEISADHASAFRGTPLSPFGADKPVLYYFDVVSKISQRGSMETRFCLVTNAKLQRTIDITQLKSLASSADKVAFMVEKFDLLIHCPVSNVARLTHTLCVLYHSLTKKLLPVTTNDPASVAYTNLQLRQPRGYRPNPVQIQSKTELINILRSAGVKPKVRRGSLNDNNAPNTKPASTTTTNTNTGSPAGSSEDLYGSDSPNSDSPRQGGDGWALVSPPRPNSP